MISEYLKDIERYLDLTSKEYGFYIMIHDFNGFLQNYVKTFPIEYGKLNEYCHLILSDERALKHCMERQLSVLDKCKEGKPFYGMCRGGLEMLTVPIKGMKEPLGFIEAGKFKGNDKAAVQSRINRMGDLYGFNKAALESMYYDGTYEKPADMEALEIRLTAAASMLSMLYTKMMQEYDIQPQITDKASFCRHIEKYIELNYMSDLSIYTLSSFFNCSPSSITHTFKKYNGSTIKSYINQVRIKEAKIKLNQTNAPISVIAKKVGISDANYFSKVFRSIEGVSPSQYQKKIQEDKRKK